MDKHNAEKGDRHERLFCNSLKNEPEVLDKLTKYFGISGTLVIAYPTGRARGKADVILHFSCGTHVGANVKSFGMVGVNQAARGTVGSFVKECNLSELGEVLQEAVVRKSKKGRFILVSDEERVLKLLSTRANAVVHYALARKENPKLLVLFDNVKNAMYIFDLKKVLNELDYTVRFSGPGNIKIGEYILFHRKGGDGNTTRFEKESPNHPGNNLAVKLDCKKFVSGIDPIATYSPKKG